METLAEAAGEPSGSAGVRSQRGSSARASLWSEHAGAQAHALRRRVFAAAGGVDACMNDVNKWVNMAAPVWAGEQTEVTSGLLFKTDK